MRQYHDLVSDVLAGGTYKPNRTGVDTVASFSHHYEVDLADGFPLLTTKRMDGYRWNSLIHELLWYLSGEEHVRNLREETKSGTPGPTKRDGSTPRMVDFGVAIRSLTPRIESPARAGPASATPASKPKPLETARHGRSSINSATSSIRSESGRTPVGW